MFVFSRKIKCTHCRSLGPIFIKPQDSIQSATRSSFVHSVSYAPFLAIGVHKLHNVEVFPKLLRSMALLSKNMEIFHKATPPYPNCRKSLHELQSKRCSAHPDFQRANSLYEIDFSVSPLGSKECDDSRVLIILKNRRFACMILHYIGVCLSSMPEVLIVRMRLI